MQERKEIQAGSLDGEEPPGGGHRKPTPVLLPRESYGQRSLVGYSPWGRIELDMNKATGHTHARCQEDYFTAADSNISSVKLSLIRPPDFCVSCLCCCSANRVRLCNSTDYNLPGSSVRGISEARILEWVAISFSRGFSWTRGPICCSFIGMRILYQ